MKGPYTKGGTFRVRLEGHAEPVEVISIETEGMNAGGGVVLVANRSGAEADYVLDALNAWDLRELNATAGAFA